LFYFAKNRDKTAKFFRGISIYFKRRPVFKNGAFYFVSISFLLFLMICSSCQTFADFNGSDKCHIVFFNSFDNNGLQNNKGCLFLNQNQAGQLETPDLKIIQNNTLGGVSTPYIVSTKVLGSVFGGNSSKNKTITEYSVQAGDTLDSIASSYGISVNTLLWANDMTSSSKIKVGQGLIILPTDGVLHIVKSGDTIIDIAKKYSALEEDIISFNELAGQEDIYIGDILVIPNGVMPKKSTSTINVQVPLADNFFIYPATGIISQGLHFYNAIDVANKCGTPIYSAASGIIQRVRYGYNSGGGNYVTILHSNGTVTYYGHLMTIFVKSGDKVSVGDRIALMGGGTGTIGDGISTGCHLHFGVTGAKNPLQKNPVGSSIKIK
jgi:LysM repeat protein